MDDKGTLEDEDVSGNLSLSVTRVTYAQNALGTDQLDQLVLLGADGVALCIGLEVTEVTDVAHLIFRGTVGLGEGVDCFGQYLGVLLGATAALTVRAGGGAAVGVVTELVDMETTLGVGVVAGDVPGDGGEGVGIGLLEGDSAGDLGVTTDDSDCGEIG